MSASFDSTCRGSSRGCGACGGRSTDSTGGGLLDCFGGDYVRLGFALGLAGNAIGTLVPAPGAILKGARFTGSRHARPGDLQEIVDLVADGAITVTIAHRCPFDIDSIRDAYAEQNTGHVRGKLVVQVS